VIKLGGISKGETIKRQILRRKRYTYLLYIEQLMRTSASYWLHTQLLVANTINHKQNKWANCCQF